MSHIMVLPYIADYPTGALGPVRVANPCAVSNYIHMPCYALLTETVPQASEHFASLYTPGQK